MAQTYRTRVLSARDRQLVDKLRTHPRYAALAERLDPTPPAPKPAPKAQAHHEPPRAAQEPAETPPPAPPIETTTTVSKPKPKGG